MRISKNFCHYNYISVVQLLLPTIDDTNQLVETAKIKEDKNQLHIKEAPLHVAVEKGNKEITKKLLTNPNILVNSQKKITRFLLL